MADILLCAVLHTMKKQLTPQEKQWEKQRKNLLTVHNGLKSDWNFGKLPTWRQLYKRMGYTDTYIEEYFAEKEYEDITGLVIEIHLDKPLLFPELKAYLQVQTNELEERIKSEGEHHDEEKKEVVQEVLQDNSSRVQVNPPTEEGHKRVESLVQATVEVKEDLTSSNNYGLLPSVKEKGFLYWFQKKAAKEILDKVNEGKRGLLLLAQTGSGKTFIEAAVLRRALDSNYHLEPTPKTWSHIPFLVITKSTVVEQTKRVFKRDFGIDPEVDCEVINIEQLRAKAGQLWVKEEVRIVEGEEESFWKWKKNIQPCVVFFDESQGAKNAGSTQSQIMCGYSDLPENTCLVNISATPFTRISEAKCFAISTHRPLGPKYGLPEGSILCSETWPTYAHIIAGDSLPTDYNQAAIERLMDDLKDYVVRVRGIRTQFDAINSVKTIPFETEEKRKFYQETWVRFEEKREKAKKDPLEGRIALLVALQQQAMAAEECHAEGFADDMYRAVMFEGKAACAAVKFKNTMIKILMFLNTKYGVPRDLVSLVWGGGQTELTKKQKAKKKIKELDEKLKAAGLSAEEMLSDLDLDEIEDRELIKLPSHLRLGLQDKEERQREIDKFQSGKTLYCMYTFRAGGVGLSLHHSDEMTTDWDRTVPGFDSWYQALPEAHKLKKGKCRRKESGYAFEEDIPFIPVRPRKNHVMLTYNAIELVQAVGRCPRLTSLSDTEQNVYCYIGTVEADIGYIVSAKLRCLTSVVKMRESWNDIIMGGNRQSVMAEHMKATQDLADESSTMIDTTEEDDESSPNGK